MSKKALIVVDVQNDFIAGSLAVPNAAGIISVINNLPGEFDEYVYTQDWHPLDHSSFKENGGPWPVHCVQMSVGSEFHKDLKLKEDSICISKGVFQEVDSYSAFFDNDKNKSTGLSERLQAKDITEVHICGLATDYCVKFSVLDALSEGFKVYVIKDACRGVDIEPGDSERALEEMKEAGAIIV